MNLNDFKILGEDSENYHISHPNGRRLSLKKGDLSDKARSAIAAFAKGGKVQKFNQGEEVASDPAYPYDPIAEPNSTPMSSAQANPNVLEPLFGSEFLAGAQSPSFQPLTLNGQTQDQMDAAKAAAAPAPAPNSAPRAPQNEVAAALDPLQQGKIDTAALLDRQEQAIKDYTASMSGIAGGQAQGMKAILEELKGKRQDYEDTLEAYQSRDEELKNAFMDQKIEPRQIFQGSTGNKILAAVSIALGGMGQGLMHLSSNPAMDVINKAIAQDIDLQKNDQTKNMNLWKMNREAMGTDLQANLATQNQLLTAAQAQGQVAAMGAQSAEAKLRGSQLINQIEAQKIRNRQELALLTPGTQSSAGTTQSGLLDVDPTNLVKDMITDPAEQKAAFDEIAKAKHVSQNYRTLMGLYDQAERENTALGRVGRLGYEPPSVKGLRALIDPLIHDQEGRINEQVLNHINAILPGPFERAGTQATNKAAFENFLQSQLQGQTFQGNTMVPLSRFKATAIPVINPMEGKTASNDQGQRIIMQNGRWVPYNGR